MKSKVIKLLCVSIFLMGATAIFAQDMIDMEWSNYNIAFQIPSDFKERECTDTLYSGATGKFSLTISPWKDANVTEIDVAKKGYDTYTATTNKQKLDEGEMPDMEESGFKAYYIVGSGTQTNKALYFIVVGVINPNSDVNFYARFAWWDNPSVNDSTVEICEQVIQSFRDISYDYSE